MSYAPYELLALDCDGTLVGPDSIIPADVVDAVTQAQAAGLRICLATGRNYKETIGIWQQLGLSEPYEPMILVGGALVSEAATGRTLYHRPMTRELACQFADALAEEGYCALTLVDAWRYKLDYLLTEAGDVDEVERRWLSRMPCTTQRVKRLSDVRDTMPDPLRITTIVAPDDGPGLVERLQARFADSLTVHAILAPNYHVWIVECFHQKTNKFNALTYVAQAHRIPASKIVAVGDDVNDLAMIGAAGMGVAMAKAPDSVKAAADVVVEGSLATFIHNLLAGHHSP
jgi:Cof subfamily protein (haloacid dehalogenase superfamily)